MINPVLVDVTRGDALESRHRGAVAVVDASGAVRFALGDIDAAVYPRSAVKALQALPLIESGAAERFGLTDAEIALACASHSGDDVHVAAAASMLERAGCSPAVLECGAHWPVGAAESRRLAASGRSPGPLHNNCSGKHAGFVCVACALGVDPAGYVGANHPVQREVRAALASMTGETLDADACGIDGCSIPTYRVPLRGLARGFARFGSGEGLDPGRAAAARRIRRAVATHPAMVAGEGRFDTIVMECLRDRVFCKVSAEGVYCAALPGTGLGVAIKIDDGAARAAEVAMGAVIRRFVNMDEDASAALAAVFEPAITNWNGRRTGDLRPGDAWGMP